VPLSVRLVVVRVVAARQVRLALHVLVPDAGGGALRGADLVVVVVVVVVELGPILGNCFGRNLRMTPN
jgi:hypothetical protein